MIPVRLPLFFGTNTIRCLHVDGTEFIEIWDNLTNPVEADLLKALERSGLQATLSEDLPAAAPKKKGKKNKGTAKRIHKITNTHIAGVDLSKDYVKGSS